MIPLERVIETLGAKCRELDDLDTQICRVIREIQTRLLRDLDVRRVIVEPLARGVTLGWSNRRGKWRLVVVDEAGACDATSTSREERLEIVQSDALARIVARAIEYTKDRRRRGCA